MLFACAWYEMLWVSSMDRAGWRHKTNSTGERGSPCFSPECRWIGADSMLLTISLVVPDLKSSKSMVDIKRRSNKAKLLKLKNQTFEVTDQPFWMQASQQSRIKNRAKSPAQDRPKQRNALEESVITSMRKQSQRKDNLDMLESSVWVNRAEHEE